MASLQLNNVPIPLLARLRERAAAERRTLDGQVIWLLEQALAEPQRGTTPPPDDRAAQLAAWRSLAGQWRGSAAQTDALIADIDAARTEGREFDLRRSWTPIPAFLAATLRRGNKLRRSGVASAG